MPSKQLYFSFLLTISIIEAQEYDISECINIALDRKGVIISAALDVESADHGLVGSYSGVLPSLNFSTSGGKTKYPVQESIIPDLINLEIKFKGFNMSF